MTTLDIMLPFWGDPELLFETVDSVRAQTCGDWRLTIIDDAYPDPSVAERYAAEHDARIAYVRNETNVGITENYAKGRSLAEAPLVMFLGCDDLMHPNFVATILAAHQMFPDAAMIQPGVITIDEHGNRVDLLTDRIKRRVMPTGTGRTVHSGEALACSLLRGNWLYWPSLVFQREPLERFPFRAGLPIVQDLALVLDMVYAGHSLVIDRTTCFSYRRHGGSASASSILNGSRFRDDRRYFSIAASQAATHGWRRAEREARLRLTSRAHALATLPTAVRGCNTTAIRMLLHHAFAPTSTKD